MINKTKELTLSAMCLTIGIILPQAFHVIPNAGNVLLPMHIPVLICGFLCGPIKGFLVGLLTPFLSHIIFQMPPTPVLGQMLVELSIYGLSTGLLNRIVNIKNDLIKNYIVLVLSMLIGRVSYGLANALIFKANNYQLSMWLTVAFVTSLPGILIQLSLVPILVKVLNKRIS